MTLVDERLPEQFSRGSLFGTGYGTRIIELDSKQEHRVQTLGAGGRRRFNVARGIAKIADDGGDVEGALSILYNFYRRMGGAFNTFLVKDWLDYATTPSGTTHLSSTGGVTDPILATDVVAELITGKTYQLVKRLAGVATAILPITYPIAATLRVADDGTELFVGPDFSLDRPNGQFTLVATPTGVVTTGFEYDVPCRFSEDADRAFQIAIDAAAGPGTGSLPAIEVVEDIQPVVFNQDRNFGGYKNHGDISANINLLEIEGSFHTFAPQVAALKAILLDNANLPQGGTWFSLRNTVAGGGNSIQIEAFNGQVLISALAPQKQVEVWLGEDTAGQPAWFAAE